MESLAPELDRGMDLDEGMSDSNGSQEGSESTTELPWARSQTTSGGWLTWPYGHDMRRKPWNETVNRDSFI